MSVRAEILSVVGSMCWFVAACSSPTAPSTSASSSSSPTTAHSQQNASPTATTAQSPSAATTTKCDPPAASGSFYALSTPTLDRASNASMCDYRGKVVLVVNVASKCGFTYQYEGLEKLHAKYHDKGFEVLGFPCNQFGGQEPGTDTEIKNFCATTYQVKFPIFSKIEVNGANQSPIYAWLKSQPQGGGNNIEWNFTKFLLDKKGVVVGRFASNVEPTSADLVAKIEAALSASPLSSGALGNQW